VGTVNPPEVRDYLRAKRACLAVLFRPGSSPGADHPACAVYDDAHAALLREVGRRGGRWEAGGRVYLATPGGVEVIDATLPAGGLAAEAARANRAAVAAAFRDLTRAKRRAVRSFYRGLLAGRKGRKEGPCTSCGRERG
jgi:hypothetical protein